jgi:hypothetical protein
MLSTSGGITLGTAISGGSQTLHASNDIVFKQLTTTGTSADAGDVAIMSDNGSVRGGAILANGAVRMSLADSITLDQLSGKTIALSAPNDITVNFVRVVKELDLAANSINVTGAQIPSVPSIPLLMNITGFNGGVATSANITIDPQSIIVDQLRAADVNFIADAPSVTILNGYVPGQLMLTTPAENILVNNRSPAPSAWASLQLYQPGGVFTLSQNGNASVTDSYVVFYSGGTSSTVTTYAQGHACCDLFTGSSLIRNVPTDMQGTETLDSWIAQKSGTETFYLLGLPGGARVDAQQFSNPVETIGSGPAVNIDGLSLRKKLRRLERETNRTGRPGWRSGQLRTNDKSVANQFAAAR